MNYDAQTSEAMNTIDSNIATSHIKRLDKTASQTISA